MARPRKDGKPAATAIRIGRERDTVIGRRARVRAYAPTPTNPNGRVSFPSVQTGKITSAVPVLGESLDEKFDAIEAYLDAHVPPGPLTSNCVQRPGRLDIRALGERYIAWLESLNRDGSYIRGRDCLLRKWVYPVIGEVRVVDWGPEESARVMQGAAPHIGKARRNDLRSVLSGLRATAHRKTGGERWLALSEDPLEGVRPATGSGLQGASATYVPARLRPATTMVEKAIAGASEVGRWGWMPDIISVAAYCGLRQAEQLGLRPWDVDLLTRAFDINGQWVTPPSGERAGQTKVRRGYRKPTTKTGTRRNPPFVGSQLDMLRRRVALALGLPEGTDVETLAGIIDQERERRAAMTTTGDWRDAVVDPGDESWLFPAEDGLPPTKEQFNSAWHAIRDAVAWNRSIEYRNLRHHAILWWKARAKNVDGTDVEWKTIADWSGHDVRTLLAYYVLASEDATAKARASLDAL